MRLVGVAVALVIVVAACGTPQRGPSSVIAAKKPPPPKHEEETRIQDDLGIPTGQGPSNGSSGGFVLTDNGSPPPPRTSSPPPPPPPSNNSSSGGFILAPSSPPPPPPPPPSTSSSDPDVEKARAVLVAAAFERALNGSDESGAEKLSTSACWKRECASITRQAKTKFKVKLLPGVTQRGTHGVAEMDVLCGGTRQCDKVWLLLEKDCVAGNRFVVADITEEKSKREGWMTNAPSACGSSSTTAPSSTISSTSTSATPGGDARIGAAMSSRPIADAERVLAGLRPRLRACFASGLRTNPEMNGRVQWTLKVAPDGSVDSATASSNAGISSEVAACGSAVLKRAQFSAPGGAGSTLVVPIVFAKP